MSGHLRLVSSIDPKSGLPPVAAEFAEVAPAASASDPIDVPEELLYTDADYQRDLIELQFDHPGG